MNERPILFSAPMVRAILDESKTQTRRTMKPTPVYDEDRWAWTWETRRAQVSWTGDRPLACALFGMRKHSPYGAVGDRLWVRETWTAQSINASDEHDHDERRALEDARALRPWAAIIYRADRWSDVERPAERWRPSIHMPRWASRITLEIIDVRVERLHDISDEDIRAEGVTAEAVRALLGGESTHAVGYVPPRLLWETGWTAINGTDSWDANPWVWAITFRRIG